MKRFLINLIFMGLALSKAFPQSVSLDRQWEVTAGNWFVVRSIKTCQTQTIGVDITETSVADVI